MNVYPTTWITMYSHLKLSNDLKCVVKMLVWDSENLNSYFLPFYYVLLSNIWIDNIDLWKAH